MTSGRPIALVTVVRRGTGADISPASSCPSLPQARRRQGNGMRPNDDSISLPGSPAREWRAPGWGEWG